MYRTILVPLDGSALSEEALPLATRLAQATHARLCLVRSVWLVPLEEMRSVDRELEAIEEAESYLAGISASLASEGVEVEMAVPFMPADKGILLEIEQRHADLVVMSTHGRSGVSRLMFGSVAEAVATHSAVPVLLVRSDRKHHPAPTLPDHPLILVPLDGSIFAEAALPYARELASALGGSLALSRVVVPPPQWVDPLVVMPYPTVEVYQREEQEAREYLAALEDQFRTEGMSVRTLLRVGRAVDSLLQVCETEAINLVVMATHGRTGLNRAVFGSVAMGVLHHGHLPLMLVRPQELGNLMSPIGAEVAAAPPVPTPA